MTQKDFMPPNGESTPRAGRSEQGLLDEAKNAASHLATEAKDEVSTRASSQKERAAKSLSSVADALRGTRHELDEKAPAFGEYADKAADTVQQLSEYIRSRNVGEIIDQVERFARRESALFLGGTVALGILAGRFLRSARPSSGEGDFDRRRFSSDDRYRQKDFGQKDFGQKDYGQKDYGQKDYGQKDYGQKDFGQKDYGQKDFSQKDQSFSVNRTGTGTQRDVTKPGGFGASGTSGTGTPATGSSGTSGTGTGGMSGTGTGTGGTGTGGTTTTRNPVPGTPSNATPHGFAGQSSNREEGSAGTGPKTGSGLPPKKPEGT
jgi:hypothetical protein